jgi:CheY-like chemotaxis protein
MGLTVSARAGAGQRILVVDDDLAIHRVIEKVLTMGLRRVAPAPSEFEHDAQAGARAAASVSPYALTFASSGQEALTLASRAQVEGAPFGVALVDMRLPGWDGIETLTRLYRIEPQLQVAICSGYMDYSWQETLERLQRPSLRQLRKPWTSGQLLAMVQELSQRAQNGGTGPLPAYPLSKAEFGSLAAVSAGRVFAFVC